MGIISSRESSNPTPAASPQPSSDELVTAITPSPSKGIWKPQQQNHHVRQASVRSRAAQPMPDHNELDKRFAKVLVSVFYFKFISIMNIEKCLIRNLVSRISLNCLANYFCFFLSICPSVW